MKPLNPKQQELLDIYRSGGTDFSLRELASKLHIAHSRVSEHRQTLAALGYIRIHPFAHRSVELVEPLEFRLRDFSNADLAAELRRRGWKGDIHHSGATA
ncbi:hypothetical protein CLG96_01995 [Sphingomonas oleivorans]|uniref:LexA repressor DNA-binding domain-containing protein n=1 Tax=Sphingomonas oleivorans TaxID=1735121 RepID=A0A2T5G1B0_9SPHN|nr:hypothetical protein [Sphingomonas oleivorans]PTQ12936.1 hypothetical protein CLG96_01995 [Sphingomonas oleivorans]